jgi:hypothetical protein
MRIIDIKISSTDGCLSSEEMLSALGQ